MKQFTGNTTLRFEACVFMGNLMENEVLIKQVLNEGGLEAVVSAMKDHPTNGYVQDNGCYALRRSLENSSTDYGEKVVKMGVVKLVVDAMNNHVESKAVLVHACTALCYFAEDNDAHRKIIIDAKGLVAVSNAYSVHSDDVQVEQAATEARQALWPGNI